MAHLRQLMPFCCNPCSAMIPWWSWHNLSMCKVRSLKPNRRWTPVSALLVKLACFWALEKSWYVYLLPSPNWFHGWADSNNVSSTSLRSPLSFTNGYLLFEWCTINGPLDGWTISRWKITCSVIAKWFGWTLGNKLFNSWVQCSNLAVIRPWVRILISTFGKPWTNCQLVAVNQP